MKLLRVSAALLVATSLTATAQTETTLNVITAGDVNMVEYVNDFLAPRFEEMHPGVRVRAVGTGPGDAGSQAIYEKIEAQRSADTWDVDVAVIHQRMAGQMVEQDLLASYRNQIETGDLVTRDTAEQALGVDVSGYVMPMFHSQIAIAYNPDLVSAPPQSYEELVDWVKQNPGQFGYNGITGGMAGVGFVFGWMYSFSDMADQIRSGPWVENAQEQWQPALASLREFNQNVVLTPGNAGTLDALNRGEIALGPVWMDMFYTWVDDGRLNPNLKLLILSPGMPGQPMYYVQPARAANQELAREFIEFATSPAIQAEGIVRKFNWFPGIDPEHVQPSLSTEEWQKLFADVSPEQLAERGMSMPQAAYFQAILEAYERNVTN